MAQDWLGPTPALVQATAKELAEARHAFRALSAYPGSPPPDLITAYRVQETLIPMMQASIAGWRTHPIPHAFRAALHSDRIAGPIFDSAVMRVARGDTVQVPVAKGWRATATVELIFELANGAAPDNFDWSLDDAIAMTAAVRWGVVIPSSPFAAISDFGPAYVAADLAGAPTLILGPVLADWPNGDFSSLRAQLGDHQVMLAQAAPDTPFESLRYALIHCAARSRALATGALITAGTAEAPLRLEPGQKIEIDFGGQGSVMLDVTAR
jgi:2-keto-4-pentenoate hydratase